MHAELLRQRHDVVAGLQPLNGHSAKFLGPPTHSSLCHLQVLSLHSVPQRVVSTLGVTPTERCAKIGRQTERRRSKFLNDSVPEEGVEPSRSLSSTGF